jgi:hypothetical protein
MAESRCFSFFFFTRYFHLVHSLRSNFQYGPQLGWDSNPSSGRRREPAQRAKNLSYAASSLASPHPESLTELRRTQTKLRYVPGELVDVDVAVGGVVERGKGLQREADTVLTARKADVALQTATFLTGYPTSIADLKSVFRCIFRKIKCSLLDPWSSLSFLVLSIVTDPDRIRFEVGQRIRIRKWSLQKRNVLFQGWEKI